MERGGEEGAIKGEEDGGKEGKIEEGEGLEGGRSSKGNVSHN